MGLKRYEVSDGKKSKSYYVSDYDIDTHSPPPTGFGAFVGLVTGIITATFTISVVIIVIVLIIAAAYSTCTRNPNPAPRYSSPASTSTPAPTVQPTRRKRR